MRLELDLVTGRGDFRLQCRASFGEGVHLISGPVGSGKTTLALALADLIPHDGLLERTGIDSVLLSMQFPEHHITASTVKGEISSWGLDAGDVITDAGLEGKEDMDPFRLSRGQLKRLVLACVLAKDPDLLILDEPFSSLDCPGKSALCQAIEGRRGVTLVFSHERSTLPRVTTLSHIDHCMLDHHGPVPEAIRRWGGAPPYLRLALARGLRPKNISIADVEEALCGTQDSGF